MSAVHVRAAAMSDLAAAGEPTGLHWQQAAGQVSTWKHVVLVTVVLSMSTPQFTNLTVPCSGTCVIAVRPEARESASKVKLQVGLWLSLIHLHVPSHIPAIDTEVHISSLRCCRGKSRSIPACGGKA